MRDEEGLVVHGPGGAGRLVASPAPPVGKWEGGYESGGDLVVARVEILPSGQVRVMAPDTNNAMGSRNRINEFVRRAPPIWQTQCH